MTKEVKPDCYAVLGLAANADDVAIRTAFAALTRQYDPKRFPGGADEAQRKLSELTAAYEILADPGRRRRYDIHRRISTLTAEFDARDLSLGHRPAAAPNSVAAMGKPRRGLAWYALIAALLGLTAFGWFAYSNRQALTRSPGPAAAPAAVDPAPATETQAPPASVETPTTMAAPQAATPSKDAANARPAPAKNASAGNAPPAATASEACTDILTALGLCKPKSTRKDK